MQDKANDIDSMYRASDGRLIAGRVQNQVIIGDEPNPEKCVTRRFLDRTFALAHLRLLADEDWAASEHKCECSEIPHIIGCPQHPETQFAASIDFSDGTKRIVQAGNLNGVHLARN